MTDYSTSVGEGRTRDTKIENCTESVCVELAGGVIELEIQVCESVDLKVTMGSLSRIGQNGIWQATPYSSASSRQNSRNNLAPVRTALFWLGGFTTSMGYPPAGGPVQARRRELSEKRKTCERANQIAIWATSSKAPEGG